MSPLRKGQKGKATLFNNQLQAKGYTIERPGELEELLPKVIANNKPAVIDCTIDDTEVPPLAGFVEGLKNFSNRLDMM